MCIDNYDVRIKNTLLKSDCCYDEAALTFATRRLVYLLIYLFVFHCLILFFFFSDYVFAYGTNDKRTFEETLRIFM